MQENNKLNRKDILRYCLMGFLIFVLLGCLVTSAIVLPVICTNRRKVANAVDSVVDSLQSQASSDYTLQNIESYTSLYGVFVNKSFSMTYEQCVEKDSYFMPFGGDTIEIKFTSTASSPLYTRSFTFSPSKITNEIIASLGGDFTLSSPVYCLVFNAVKDGDDLFGTRYNYVIYSDIEDYNKLIAWNYNEFFSFSNPLPAFFDFNSIPKSGDSTTTYGNFVPSVTGMSADMLNFWSDFLYLSLPSIGAGGGTSEDDIKNAYNDGYSKGISDYLYNSGLVYPLNVDSYVSTGGFTVKDGDKTHEVLLAKSVENHTNNNSSTVDGYSFMPYGVNGNLIYTQGASPTIDSDFNGTAGYYGVKSSFVGNGVSNVIKAGTPFSLDMAFARSSSNKISGVYTNVDYTILFLDKSMTPIYYNSAYSGDYFINNTILGMGSESDGMLLSDVLTSGDVHFYNFPVDVYGIMLISYHNANEFAHAYSLTARFLGDTKSQEAYDNGFSAGVNSINKNDIFNQGYTKGFSEGSAEGSNYTFMSLLGAVIDAPISAFTGMFDFTLLGVNLRSFILAMLTLAIVIVLIRIALGGK